MSIELKAMLQEHASSIKVISRIYGLSGKDFYVEEAVSMLRQAYAASLKQEVEVFDYSGRYQGEEEADRQQYFAPITLSRSTPGITSAETLEDGSIKIKGGTVRGWPANAAQTGARSWSLPWLWDSNQCQPTVKGY